MGLDQYLTAKTLVVGGAHAPEGSRTTYDKIITAVGSPAVREKTLPTATVSVSVGYWRKENAIHKWFVDNVQEGEDNCAEYFVSREGLTELKELCKKVLADHSLADELLPTGSGFFFGSTDYDDWYFTGLQETVEIVDTCLSSQYENWEFTYQSSW
jgi:hypothetical protein